MYLEAPWTQVGALQQEVNNIKNQFYGKVDKHEIFAINSRLDSMERALREISASLARIQSQLQVCEDKIKILDEAEKNRE